MKKSVVQGFRSTSAGNARFHTFGDRLQKFNAALAREGAFCLFTLRLIPAVPFFVISVVMGLSRIPLVTYCWVSQVGMFAGNCISVYAGSAFPDLKNLAERGTSGVLSPQLLAAFMALGVFPLLARRILQRFRPRPPAVAASSPVNNTHTNHAPLGKPHHA